jgi:hypothetical protein
MGGLIDWLSDVREVQSPCDQRLVIIELLPDDKMTTKEKNCDSLVRIACGCAKVRCYNGKRSRSYSGGLTVLDAPDRFQAEVPFEC